LREATRILAIRHGETAWNAEMRMQGQLNTPLNDIGRWQADRLAAAIRRVDRCDHTSDLDRAVQLPLARPSEDRRRRAVCASAHSASLVCSARSIAAGPLGDALANARRGSARKVVSLHCHQHCIKPLSAWSLTPPAHDRGSHGGVLTAFIMRLPGTLDAPLFWSLGNAVVNQLLYADQGLMLVGWGDSRHLQLTRTLAPDRRAVAARRRTACAVHRCMARAFAPKRNGSAFRPAERHRFKV
jgi:probable phosphoglycerate mutase